MLQGVLALISAAVVTGIVPTFQKQLVSDGLPIFSMMLFNCSIIEVATFFVAKFRGHSLKIKKKQFIQAMFMGPAGTFLNTALLNYAYQHISVGTATMIHYFYPTVTCILMGVVFKQGFSKLQVMAIITSIAGMFMLTGQSGATSPIGILFAFASAILYGSYVVANEKGEVNELPLEVKMFYTSLPSLLVVAGVLIPITRNFALPGSVKSWTLLLGCSIIGALGGSFLLLFGIKKLGATTASFLAMLTPIVSVVFSTIWFSDPISKGMVIGTILILISTCLITINSAQRAKKT